MRCPWCAARVDDALDRCPACSARVVAPDDWGVARMLVDAGVDKLALPERVTSLAADDRRALSTVFERHATAIRARVREGAALAAELRDPGHVAELEDRLWPTMPARNHADRAGWLGAPEARALHESERLAALVLDDKELHELRTLAALVLERRGAGTRETLRHLESLGLDDSAAGRERAVIVYGLRISLGHRRERSWRDTDAKQALAAAMKVPGLHDEALVAHALLEVERREPLTHTDALRALLGSRERDVRFGAALALDDTAALDAFIDDEDEALRETARRRVGRAGGTLLQRRLRSAKLETKHELVKAMREVDDDTARVLLDILDAGALGASNCAAEASAGNAAGLELARAIVDKLLSSAKDAAPSIKVRFAEIVCARAPELRVADVFRVIDGLAPDVRGSERALTAEAAVHQRELVRALDAAGRVALALDAPHAIEARGFEAFLMLDAGGREETARACAEVAAPSSALSSGATGATGAAPKARELFKHVLSAHARLHDDTASAQRPNADRVARLLESIWVALGSRRLTAAHALSEAVRSWSGISNREVIIAWAFARFLAHADERRALLVAFSAWKDALREAWLALPLDAHPASGLGHLDVWLDADDDPIRVTEDAFERAGDGELVAMSERLLPYATALLGRTRTTDRGTSPYRLGMVVAFRVALAIANRARKDDPSEAVLDAARVLAERMPAFTAHADEMRANDVDDAHHFVDDIATELRLIDEAGARRRDAIERALEHQRRDAERAARAAQRELESAAARAEAERQAAEQQERMRQTLEALNAPGKRLEPLGPVESIDIEPYFGGKPLPALLDYVRVLKAMQSGQNPMQAFATAGLDVTSWTEASLRWSQQMMRVPELAQRFGALLAMTWA